MASSIHIANGTSSMGIHNTRVFAPDYLIVADKSVNEYKSFTDKHINDLVEMAKSDYKAHQKNNRSLPKNATLIKEAIVNLESHHNMGDMELLKSTLEKEYGYLISNISIHKDEGYIYTDKINYTMGREQYKNKEETPHIAELDIKENKFYEWHKINNEWTKGKEISEYEIKFNYHAHIEILNYDFKTHRTIRNNLKAMSKMQTLVAQSLGMQRGKCSSTVEAKRIGVEVQESRKRMNIKDYKNYKRKENELKSELSKVKEENKELKKYDFKEMQKKITQLEELNSSQKRELHQLNSQVKNNKAEFETLEKRIETYKKAFKTIAPEAKNTKEVIEKVDQLQQEATTYKQSYTDLKKLSEKQNKLIDSQDIYITQKEKEIDTLKKQNKSLQEQKSVLPSKDTNLSDKNDSRPNMNYLTASKELEIEFKNGFEEKEIKTGMFSSEKIKVLKPVKDKEESLYSRIKSKFTDMYEYMKKQYDVLKEQYQELTLKYNNLVKENRSVKLENAELKAKVKELTLSHTGEKQLNKLVDDYEKAKPSAMDLLKEMQKKEISKEDTERFVKETREQLSQLKNTGPILDR